MNIYLSPEAIEVGRKAACVEWNCPFSPQLAEAFAVGCRALIQYIVENPPKHSDDECMEVMSQGTWLDSYKAAISLAFTPPTPDVPEQLVAVIDKHTALATKKGGWTADMIRDLACESAEVGK